MAQMLYRRLDSSWDYTWGSGISNYLTDVDATAQAIKSRLLLWLGEFFLDINSGLPMFQGILGYAGTNKESVDRLISDRILGTTWNGQKVVTAITYLDSSYNPNTRAYTFQAQVETIFGTVSITTGA